MKLQEHNLTTTQYLNGDPIRHAQSDEDWVEAGEKGEGAYCISPTGGHLYNWYAVNDPRGIGRVPTDKEWDQVVDLESLQVCDGLRNDYGSFNYQGDYTAFWSSSSYYSSDFAWFRDLHSDFSDLDRNYDLKSYGFSVRCVEVG